MLVKDYEKTLMKIIKILTPTAIFPWVNYLLYTNNIIKEAIWHYLLQLPPEKSQWG